MDVSSSNCAEVTPGSVVLIQDPKMGCACVSRGDVLGKKRSRYTLGVTLLLTNDTLIKPCICGGWVWSTPWNAGEKEMQEERAGRLRERLVSLCYPGILLTEHPELTLSTPPLGLAYLQILRQGWWGD